MKIVEQIGDIFGETKYSITLFGKGKKLNLNQKIADLGVGYTNCSLVADTQSSIICLKGGIDAPKIFNRFRHVDSPER